MARNETAYCEHSIDRRITFRSLLSLLLDFENSHHAVVFVIEDVAVEHPLPRIVVVAHDDSRRRMFRDVEHVLPGEIRLAHSVTVQHLELESMQVERVIHANDVLDLPDLGGADG